MAFDVEDIISKCVAGGVPRDILETFEDDLPDVQTVRSHLMRDINRLGFRVRGSDVQTEGMCITVAIDSKLLEHKHDELTRICDAYTRIYPEIEVLMGSK